MESMDSILSGSGETAPEGQTTETEQVANTATTGEGQAGQETEGETGEGDQQGRMVPMQALEKEKHKVKRYTEEVASFRNTVEAQSRQIAELMQRIPVPQQPKPEPTDFFADPDKALNERLQNHLGQAFGPVQEQLQAQAHMLAGIKFGDDKVAEAEKAFLAAVQARTLDPADYHRVRNSPNRYAEAVKWHQRQQAQAEIGEDPAAYKARIEAEIREKVLAEINGGNGQQAQRQAAPAGTMPSNLAAARNTGSRSGPAWAGPASLQDIFDRRPGKG